MALHLMGTLTTMVCCELLPQYDFIIFVVAHVNKGYKIFETIGAHFFFLKQIIWKAMNAAYLDFVRGGCVDETRQLST